MTIYRIKYRRLGFLFDLLSFLAFIAIIASSALYFFHRQSWWYILYSVAAFAVLKSISKSILSVKISIDTSSMHDPTSHAKTKAAASNRPAQEPVLKLDPVILPDDSDQQSIPVLEEVIAEPELVEDDPLLALRLEKERRNQKRQRLHEQKRLKERNDFLEKERAKEEKQKKKAAKEAELQRQIKAKKDKERLKEQQLAAEHEKFQQQLERQEKIESKARTKKAISFKCDYIGDLDSAELHEDYLDICRVDSRDLILGTPDISGDFSVFETIHKDDISRITYEEFRNSSGKKFRVLPWLTAGVVSGLLICLVLVIMSYKKTGHLPGEAWIITTMLPLMALSTFAGLFTGILIPHKKTKVHILYTIYRSSKGKIRFSTGFKNFKKAKRAFSVNNFEFNEAL